MCDSQQAKTIQRQKQRKCPRYNSPMAFGEEYKNEETHVVYEVWLCSKPDHEAMYCIPVRRETPFIFR